MDILREYFHNSKMITAPILSENRLDQLVRISVDDPPIQNWDSSSALDIWYKGKTRRITATTRASTSKHHSEDEDDQELRR